MRKIILAIILLLSNLEAGTVAGTGGSLETTQWARWLDEKKDSIKDYAQFAKNVQHNLKQLETMRINLKKLNSRDWINFENQVRELKKLVGYQDALTYAASNYETLFKNRYKDYGQFVRMYQGTTGVKDFNQEYKTLNKSTRNTVESSLKQLNLSMDDMENDKVIMDRLRGLSKSSVGQKQAISVVSQISLHSIEQLKKLEKVLMSNNQLHAAWIAKQNSREEMEDAAYSTRLPANGRDLTINYGKAY